MTLRELRAVRSVYQRDMREGGHGPVHRLVDDGLTRGVGEMIVAADHMGDAHVMVVDHDRQHVGGRAVRTQKDQVVERRRVPVDRALNQVVDQNLALAWRL